MFQNCVQALKESVEDREDNKTISRVINSFYPKEYQHLINDTDFCHNFFTIFIKECMTTAEEECGGYRLVVNEKQLQNRSDLMRQFVFNYTEYQLNLLMVLCDIKTRLPLTDAVFDGLIKSLHANGVVTEEAANHWFRCNRDFNGRQYAVANAIQLLDWTREAREEHFYELFENEISFDDMMVTDTAIASNAHY